MMTEEEALARLGADALKVEGSLEIRQRTNTHTGDFLRRWSTLLCPARFIRLGEMSLYPHNQH